MLIQTLKRHWWVPVIRGMAAIIFGVIAFVYPGLTVALLVLLFGAWVLVDGIFRVIGAISHRASDPDWEIKGEWFLLLMGLASIAFAFLLLWNPVAGAAAVIWIIAWYAVILGVLGIIFGFRLRSLPTLPVR